MALSRRLTDELSVKVAMTEHLMTREPWDLFTVAISSGHCAGHQLWGLHEAALTGEVPVDPLVENYEAIDTVLGRLIEAAGPDTGVVLFTSHGMGGYVAGYQHLPRLLEAWGYGAFSRMEQLRQRLPLGPVERLIRRGPRWLRRGAMAAGTRAGLMARRLDAGVTAVPLMNNRVGAVRLNVVGREPHGTVAPGEVDSVLAGLEQRLARVRHVPSGEPVVVDTVRTADLYGPDRHPDLPDLLVRFRQDLGEIDVVECPEAGRMERPVRSPTQRRSGDHTEHSEIWIDHPAVESLGPLRTVDIGATVVALLGLPPQEGVDGRSAVTLRHPTGS